MLLTASGIGQFEYWRSRITDRLQEIVLGRSIDSFQSYQAIADFDEDQPALSSALRQPEADLMRFRSHLRTAGTETDLAGYEQRARILALRGLSQARDGEYERAQTTFASAARLDPRLDLALLPSFWDLPRRAHEVAIAALHDANRARDAAALTATMRTRFRPRVVRGINQTNVQPGFRNE